VKELPEYQSKYVHAPVRPGQAIPRIARRSAHVPADRADRKALEYQQEHPTEIRLGKLYQNAERLLGKINAQIRNVSDIEGEEKRQRLDHLYEVRNRIAKAIEERGRKIQEQAQ
jgi:hypothetical protein